MTMNTIIRADVRARIMEAARSLAALGRPFRQAEIIAAMGRSVTPRVFAYELEDLRQAGELRRVREKSGPRPALYVLGGEPETWPGADAGAPDWKPGYPSTGEYIGPAWRAMWEWMADHEWRVAGDLAIVGAEAGDILPGTARNLLFPAAKAGFIEPDARYDETIRRWCTWYRRPA
jgi:hypothetical protein